MKREQYWRTPSAGRMLLFLTWLSMSAVVPGSEVRRMVAKSAQAPKLDGTLDDACWQAAPTTEPFLSIGTHTAAAKQTRVRVAYDRTALYLGLEADEPDMQAVRAPSRPRDADETWKDDGFEIFLTPGPGDIKYYHFIGNLAGAKYDALMGGEEQMVAWNPDPDWQVAVSRAAGGWTAEVAIPFKALDAAPPRPGEFWGLKVCRSLWSRGGDRRDDGLSAWAHSPSVDYHDPAGWGQLYLGSINCLPNGTLSRPAKADGLPPAWRRQLNWGKGQPEFGFVRQEQRDGRNVLHLHKKTEHKKSALPRTSASVHIRGGRRYRASASVSARATVRLSINIYTKSGSSSVSTPFPMAEDGFRTISAEVDFPPDAYTAGVTLSLDSGSAGDLWIREAALTDLGKLVRTVEADLIHELKTAAATMVDMKPYPRLRDAAGRYPYERLIFRDTGTGAEIRRITWDWHAATTGYSNRYPWNANGTAFRFSCWDRPGEGLFIAEPDGGAFKPVSLTGRGQGAVWGKDPDVLVHGTRDTLTSMNWRTGETKPIYTIPQELMHGRRPRFKWNLDLPGLVYYEQAFGTDAPLYFVDLKTGRHTRIPITSDSTGDKEKDWLYSAGLTQIDGTWYVRYSLNHLPHLSEQNPYQQRLGTIDGKRGLNRLSLSQPEGKPPQPLYSHGGTAPNRKYECGFRGGGIRLWDFEKWEGCLLVAGPRDGHISWEYHNDWFFAGTNGAPLSGPFSSLLLKVYTDGTWYPVAYGNTVNREYKGNFFANISPDGTKGSFSSTMLGPINLYWVVISYPDPPDELVAKTVGRQVSLSWRKPAKSAELAGYHVYRSTESGCGYRRRTREPVTTTRFTDVLPDPARPFFYVVTAVEHSGLESRSPSNEACAGRVDASVCERLLVEAEHGTLTPPLRENFHGSASNLLFVDYRDGNGESRAAYSFVARNGGEHALWVRTRLQGTGAPARGWAVEADDHALGQLRPRAGDWKWLRLEPTLDVAPGRVEVVLKAAEPGYAVDKLLFTDHLAYIPKGEVRLDPEPPGKPAGLKAGEVRHFDVSLAWTPVTEDCAYYHVYRGAAADFSAHQTMRVGSPAMATFVDWGLTHGKTYHYRVAAVDSFGNESEPTPAVVVKTPALEQAVDLAFEAESSVTSLPMAVVEEKDASGGKYVKMAPEGEGEERVFPVLALDFEVPVAGEYVVWVKLCPVSNRGYAYVSARMDGGPSNMFLCSFSRRARSEVFGDSCLWKAVGRFRDMLPTRFSLAPGKHTLELASEPHLQDYGVDSIRITNDLSTRPPGRHLPWR